MAAVDSFLQAHPSNYKATQGRNLDLIVFHDMEAPEAGQTAENVAAYFARQHPPGQASSAHYNVDNNTVVQSVRDKDIAYCAPGANHNGLHIEHAGYARQTTSEWLDPYGRAMLLRSAKLAEELCTQYQIPIKFITEAGLKLGHRGITTHAAVSQAFRRSSHTDPGFNFPMAYYINLVQVCRNERSKGWPVPLPKWVWDWMGWKLAGSPKGKRPANAPAFIPLWAWNRYRAFLAARRL